MAPFAPEIIMLIYALYVCNWFNQFAMPGRCPCGVLIGGRVHERAELHSGRLALGSCVPLRSAGLWRERDSGPNGQEASWDVHELIFFMRAD